jgi:CheY-like chemotaxis protein
MSAPHDPAVPRPVRLLLVEPHASTREVFTRFLRGRGYHVTAAAGYHEALRLCLLREFDLLLCETVLPDGSGADLLRALSAQCGLPAMAVSAAAYPADVSAGLAAGFRVYLTKPLTVNRLVSGIRTALRTC